MSSPVVLITGALTGIGRATALAFAKDGASIVASGRREAEGKALEAELRSLGTEAAFIRADVRHDDEVRNLVDQTVARFGRIDSAVNAAGTEGQPGPLIDQSSESYAATFDTNVLGTLLSLKHELRVMQAQGHGSIINISSTYGHEGAAGAAVYAASKHAVEGLTKSAALEGARSGVRVNAVAPGPTETGMLNRFTGTAERKAALAKTVPLGRVGEADSHSQQPPMLLLGVAVRCNGYRTGGAMHHALHRAEVTLLQAPVRSSEHHEVGAFVSGELMQRADRPRGRAPVVAGRSQRRVIPQQALELVPHPFLGGLP